MRNSGEGLGCFDCLEAFVKLGGGRFTVRKGCESENLRGRVFSLGLGLILLLLNLDRGSPVGLLFTVAGFCERGRAFIFRLIRVKVVRLRAVTHRGKSQNLLTEMVADVRRSSSWLARERDIELSVREFLA
jgi:hypothetical protein